MERDAFTDIANAFMQLRVAFIRNGLEPPAAIELGSVKDGDYFRYAIGKEMIIAQPRMGVDRDNPEWVCNIVGVEVRMPAAWRREAKGRRVLNDPDFRPISDLWKD